MVGSGTLYSSLLPRVMQEVHVDDNIRNVNRTSLRPAGLTVTPEKFVLPTIIHTATTRSQYD